MLALKTFPNETTMNLDKSEATARLILQHYVQSVTADLGNSIYAIYLTGSLAAKSYIPGPGDIDQITILNESVSEDILKKVASHIESTKNSFNHIINLSSVVYRIENMVRPWPIEWDYKPETKHMVCIPEELLRIHDHGQVLFGKNLDTTQITRPTLHEMIDYHERWRLWGKTFQERHPGGLLPDNYPARIAVQFILSNSIWHYFYATGKTCFNKHKIGVLLQNEIPNYRFLQAVKLATKIRLSGFENITSETLFLLRQWCDSVREYKENHSVNDVPRIDE